MLCCWTRSELRVSVAEKQKRIKSPTNCRKPSADSKGLPKDYELYLIHAKICMTPIINPRLQKQPSGLWSSGWCWSRVDMVWFIFLHACFFYLDFRQALHSNNFLITSTFKLNQNINNIISSTVFIDMILIWWNLSVFLHCLHWCCIHPSGKI